MLYFNLFKTSAKITAKITIVLALLSACVVRPLYKAADKANNNIFTHLEIAIPPDHFVQLISNKLEDLLHGGTIVAKATYKLQILAQYNYRTNLIVSDRGGIDASAQAISGVIDASANYIVKTHDNKQIAIGTVHATVPYDRLEQEYANLKARERARAEAADDIAEQIRFKLMQVTFIN